MIRLILPAVILLSITAATYTYAKSDNSKSPNTVNQNQIKTENQVRNETTVQSKNQIKEGSSSAQTCDPNYPWKNHGEYVACVAKLKQGGQVVSQAAQSDVGKKSGTGTPSASLTPSPTSTISATPTSTPSASPTVIASQSATVNQPVNLVIKSVRGWLKKLQSLFIF